MRDERHPADTAGHRAAEPAGRSSRTLLEKRWAELGRLLGRIAGRAEFGLKVSWTDLQRSLREVVAGDRDSAGLRDRLARRPTGGDLRGAARARRPGSPAAGSEARARGGRAVAALGKQAVSVCRHDPISELMVLNAAFLVERRTGRGVRRLGPGSGPRQRGTSGASCSPGPCRPTTSSVSTGHEQADAAGEKG